MYNMLSSTARCIRDSKRSNWQVLRDEYVCHVDCVNFGLNYMEDTAKCWKEFQELRKTTPLNEVVQHFKILNFKKKHC